MDMADGGIHIQLHGAPATAAVMPVGTEDPFAHGFRFRVSLFFSDEPVRDQLAGLFTMPALGMLQLHGLLLDRVDIGIVNAHGGTGLGKRCSVPY